MKDQKQIEKMAKDICYASTCRIKKKGGTCYKRCKAFIYASRAAEAGYLKQSGWVSVEDRLPEREGIYLICTISGHMRLGEFRPYFMGDKPQFDPYTTHWMPLPEPPTDAPATNDGHKTQAHGGTYK